MEVKIKECVGCQRYCKIAVVYHDSIDPYLPCLFGDYRPRWIDRGEMSL